MEKAYHGHTTPLPAAIRAAGRLAGSLPGDFSNHLK
jgi:hypothetical protein